MRASLRNVSINTQKIIKSKNWWMWSRYTWMQKIHQDSLVHTSEYLSRVSHTSCVCVCVRVCLSVCGKRGPSLGQGERVVRLGAQSGFVRGRDTWLQQVCADRATRSITQQEWVMLAKTLHGVRPGEC